MEVRIDACFVATEIEIELLRHNHHYLVAQFPTIYLGGVSEL
jgi:hypothetical protein